MAYSKSFIKANARQVFKKCKRADELDQQSAQLRSEADALRKPFTEEEFSESYQEVENELADKQ